MIIFEPDVFYYHPDHLGSSTFITDLTGEVYQHLEYFPFGETWVEEVSNHWRVPYLFTAKELDRETGLYYFGARYYDPRTSVWQSADPIDRYHAQSPTIALNLYQYALLNPLRLVDPSGLEEEGFMAWWNSAKAGITAWVGNKVKNYIKPDAPDEQTRALQEQKRQTLEELGMEYNPIGERFADKMGEVAEWGTEQGIGLAEDYAVGKGVAAAGGIIGGATKGAFEIAKQGGRHSGFLKNNLGRTTEQLQKGISKLERQMAVHQDKIANPAKHIKDWHKLDPRQQQALINKKWPSDIQRQMEQRDILQGILKSRN